MSSFSISFSSSLGSMLLLCRFSVPSFLIRCCQSNSKPFGPAKCYYSSGATLAVTSYFLFEENNECKKKWWWMSWTSQKRNTVTPTSSCLISSAKWSGTDGFVPMLASSGKRTVFICIECNKGSTVYKLRLSTTTVCHHFVLSCSKLVL